MYANCKIISVKMKFKIDNQNQLSPQQKKEITIIKNISLFEFYDGDEKSFDFIEDIKNHKLITGDKPDFTLGGYGIEHTLLSWFFKNKKGDILKQNERIINDSAKIFSNENYKIEFRNFLNLNSRLRQEEFTDKFFIKNLKNQVIDKNCKLKKYSKLQYNCLLLEFPYFLDFLNESTPPYLWLYLKYMEHSNFDLIIFVRCGTATVISKSFKERVIKTNIISSQLKYLIICKLFYT